MVLQSSYCMVEGRQEVMVARHSRKSQVLALEQGWKAKLSPCVKEDVANSVFAHQKRSLSARMCCDSCFLAGGSKLCATKLPQQRGVAKQGGVDVSPFLGGQDYGCSSPVTHPTTPS